MRLLSLCISVYILSLSSNFNTMNTDALKTINMSCIFFFYKYNSFVCVVIPTQSFVLKVLVYLVYIFKYISLKASLPTDRSVFVGLLFVPLTWICLLVPAPLATFKP